jgi:phosphoribosylanthranilate isomerase
MWVKICGVRDVASAAVVARAGADAVGLNFYPRSQRCLTLETARAIVASLSPQVEPVGLFVNAELSIVRETAAALNLRTIQLHGDESPEYVAALGEFRIIRAFRVGAAGCERVQAELTQLAALGATPWRCLVDASVPGEYGGTGFVAPWETLRDEWSPEWPPLILAGGLTPGNVAEAVACCRPWGVDVAGGVETAPGIKDENLSRAFVENARRAS